MSTSVVSGDCNDDDDDDVLIQVEQIGEYFRRQ